MRINVANALQDYACSVSIGESKCQSEFKSFWMRRKRLDLDHRLKKSRNGVEPDWEDHRKLILASYQSGNEP